jgi:uncharacterized protein (DUF1501 family)
MARNNGKQNILSRRDILKGGAALSALAATSALWKPWMPRLSFARNGVQGDVMVCVFLRGGADGLNVIVPHGDNDYYAARPTLAIARPDDSSADAGRRSLDLDGFFGLHPALSPLHPIFKGGGMAAVHATGSPDPTRSHFDAMSYMELGTPGSFAISSGWLGRHLNTMQNGNNSPVRAVGWTNALQTSLRGAVSSIALKSIVDYHLQGREEAAEALLNSLNALYVAAPEELDLAARQTQEVLRLVAKIDINNYQPANGVQYQENDFHLALKQTAALIKADVGMEVSAIDLGGWDTHLNQDDDLAENLSTLASGLAAFHADMGVAMAGVTVVVMSEFGRRVQENASKGTDHGHGNAMLVMGGNVINKPVLAKWPGLNPDQLDRGDLSITIDYRDVLAEVLAKRVGNPDLAAVFPEFSPTMPGVIRG